MKVSEIKPMYVEFMPDELEEGVLYISERFELAMHLCACGCGEKTVTPIGSGRWVVTKVNEQISLRPSIGNWSGESPYHAHYYITNNKIEWL